MLFRSDPDRGIDPRAVYAALDRIFPADRIVVTDNGRFIVTLPSLIEARDATADGHGKLERIFGHVTDHAGRVVVLFDSSQLGLALGRAHVIHAALARGPAADAFLGRCRRLAQYRGVALDGTACG